ncbi:LCP family protein [Nocardioides campestrisoli]|uniref:LCP family protein n=1 Tax=Nocardioides campestrisoli TaxID=2736757 RepID=UPI00163D5178|nr:LCP family protein [Nocardioides campestrisoli]
MADRPRGKGGPQEGTPEYQWLYGSQGSGPADDATRAVQRPASGRPSSSAQAPADHTRVMPASPAPTPAPGRRGAGAPPPAGPPPGRSRKPGGRGPRLPRPRIGVFRVVRWVLLLWLVFLVAVPFWAWSKVTKVEADPGGDRPAEQPGTTYLLVGSDSRGDLTEEERERLGTGGDVGQRTDTIMLLHTGDGPNLLMSIPRDSIVPIPGHSTTKINAAYAWGGPELLVQTVEQNTGIRVDHYVEVGFGGFVDMVDAVGGVEICPENAMKDPQAKLDIPAGCQEADGPTALGYARSRKTSADLGDIKRAENQREVVSAVGDEALSPWTFVNPLRYYQLSTATARSFAVSDGSSPLSIGRFGLAMTRVDGENGLTCGIPIRDLAVNWDAERSQQLFDLIIADDTASIPDNLCTPSGLLR